uniref:Uncharacterized protein n=1 Tax=Arundo donax TaxID=35708 RepID=A0A0A9C9R3_ARUDO
MCTDFGSWPTATCSIGS